MTDGSGRRDEPRVLLVGMMGSGKTTVGRALSERTGWPYLDNDELLRTATGKDAHDLLEDRGVEALRSGEAAAFQRALTVPPPIVAGVAAGVVLDEASRRRLRDAGCAVWLRARPETLVERIEAGPDRPWTEGDLERWVRQRTEERAPFYREVADVVIDVDDRSVDEIVEAIIDALGGPIVGGRQD